MDLKQQHEALKQYLLSRFHAGDWHGVSDAANDLRVLEAQMAKKEAPPKRLGRSELEQAFRKANGDWDISGRIRRGHDSMRGIDVMAWIFEKVADELGLAMSPLEQ